MKYTLFFFNSNVNINDLILNFLNHISKQTIFIFNKSSQKTFVKNENWIFTLYEQSHNK